MQPHKEHLPHHVRVEGLLGVAQFDPPPELDNARGGDEDLVSEGVLVEHLQDLLLLRADLDGAPEVGRDGGDEDGAEDHAHRGREAAHVRHGEVVTIGRAENGHRDQPALVPEVERLPRRGRELEDADGVAREHEEEKRGEGDGPEELVVERDLDHEEARGDDELVEQAANVLPREGRVPAEVDLEHPQLPQPPEMIGSYKNGEGELHTE
mmetsp:Transcript_56708/g.149413  ORF Transcript_56708/g.149413 Transcript_56708/m.149413 type:complete len:210 (-) Transcript_56708:67-696(-)